MSYSVLRVREHYEVYDRSGRFLFSADTEAEAISDMGEYRAELQADTAI